MYTQTLKVSAKALVEQMRPAALLHAQPVVATSRPHQYRGSLAKLLRHFNSQSQ